MTRGDKGEQGGTMGSRGSKEGQGGTKGSWEGLGGDQGRGHDKGRRKGFGMRDVMPRRVDTHLMVDFLKCRFVSVRTVYMPQVFCVMLRGGRHACYDGPGSKGASQWTWGAAENGARELHAVVEVEHTAGGERGESKLVGRGAGWS